jgi:hypothetical protein
MHEQAESTVNPHLPSSSPASRFPVVPLEWHPSDAFLPHPAPPPSGAARHGRRCQWRCSKDAAGKFSGALRSPQSVCSDPPGRHMFALWCGCEAVAPSFGCQPLKHMMMVGRVACMTGVGLHQLLQPHAYWQLLLCNAGQSQDMCQVGLLPIQSTVGQWCLWFGIREFVVAAYGRECH